MGLKNMNQYFNNCMKGKLAVLQNANTFNLHGTLEFLHMNTNIDTQVKLFSLLSAYLTLEDAKTDVVLTCNYVYDKITNFLANSPPRKAAVGLNFLSALLYIDEDRKRNNLVLYAKNMIRASGCLATMCDLFTSCMMHQETWRALCRSLAESCRGVEANQSYCSHLVPMCVQRCNHRNVDAFLVLTSLLQNHNNNKKLFIESNGASLFTREFLQYEACLELLAILVDGPSAASTVLSKSNIWQHLQDFLQLYGPNSQLGQWATIILYRTTKLKECPPINLSSVKNDHVEAVNTEKSYKTFSNVNNDIRANDTTLLFQNIVKEILQCEPKAQMKDLNNFLTQDAGAKCNQKYLLETSLQDHNNDDVNRSHVKNMRNTNTFVFKGSDKLHITSGNNNRPMKNNNRRAHAVHNLSFSFLRESSIQNKNIRSNYGPYSDRSTKLAKIDEENTQRNAMTQTDTYNLKQTSDAYEPHPESFENRELTDVTEFEPIFASTPKRNVASYHTKKANNSANRSILDSTKPHPKQRAESKSKIRNKTIHQELNKFDKQLKNRSLSARFFDAINGSCTTLVNTVKHMFVFKSKVSENDNVTDINTTENAPVCNYSFTKYMRRRDAILLNNNNNKSRNCSNIMFSFENSNSCNSCNNTVALKRKLADNEYLKRTVKKLKVGINLYGCDFKKISKNLWPQEAYMTPVVLYNLYRKLIIK